MIAKEKLIELYSAMVMCRMIAERAGVLAREANLSSGLDAGLGREATIAGVAVDLLAEDTLQAPRDVFVSHFLKGMPLDALIAGAIRSSNGRAQVAPRGNGNAFADLETACAAAKEHKATKDRRITVAFSDTEQTYPEAHRETHAWRLRTALRMASRDNLPLILVRYRAVRSETAEKPKRNGTRRRPADALEFGVPAIYVDGDDVVAVYRVASESIARARRRGGPTLIDCVADRSASSGGTAPAVAGSNGLNGFADPLAIMESHLAGKGLFNRGLRRKITEGFAPELEKATRSLAQPVQQRA